ncbi:MAG TPA: hypothetical protein VFT66_00475 [Roseiflexaceae bacterium]|nr:hypothetical protein [Roseiflexaceae bacterium]
MMMRLMTTSVLVLLAAMLGACGVPDGTAGVPRPTVVVDAPTSVPTAPPTDVPTATPIPPTAAPTQEPTAVPPVERDTSNVLVQLDYEPTFFRPEASVPFGRVPRFTLLKDGRVFYLDAGDPPSYDQERLMDATLSPDETAAFVQKIRDLGFAQLESYTDMCQTSADGQQNCVADASFSIIRVRQPDGTLREVRNYHNFANQPQVLEQIRTLLTDYRNAAAQPYQPERAALFIRVADGDLTDRTVLPWPLAADWLQPRQPGVQLWARVLEGKDLATFLAAVPRNTGDFWFRADDKVYQTYLVPWLPGEDYTDAVQHYGLPETS